MPNTIEWSEEEMQLLIDLRRNRNNDYWRRFGRSKIPFWDEIVTKIQKDLGMTFTGVQVSEKFKEMVKKCKLFEKFADKIPGGRWTYVEASNLSPHSGNDLVASHVVTQRMMNNDNNHSLSSLPPDDYNSSDDHNFPEPQQTDPPVTDHNSPKSQQTDPPVTDPLIIS